MVDAAALSLQLNAAKYAVVIKNYRLFKGVVFDGSEPDALIIDIATADDNTSAAVKVSSIKSDGKPQFHYGCDIAFIANAVAASDEAVPVSLKTMATDKTIYANGTLFHNDSLQGIEAFEISKTSAWFRCRLPESISSKVSGFSLDIASSNVFANDLVYQAMLVWVREQLGLGSLPSTTLAWTFNQSPSLYDAFYIQLSDMVVQGNSIKANALLVNDNGDVLATVKSCEVTASESLKNTFKRAASVGQT